VLIRPEALRITMANGATPPQGAVRGHILAARMLRRASFLHLCLGDFAGAHLHFHCRLPGHNQPKVGDQVHVALDSSQAFVFPIDPRNRPPTEPAVGCPPGEHITQN
jgi:iron(III) transport system ATP-binding protein